MTTLRLPPVELARSPLTTRALALDTDAVARLADTAREVSDTRASLADAEARLSRDGVHGLRILATFVDASMTDLAATLSIPSRRLSAILAERAIMTSDEVASVAKELANLASETQS